MSERVLIIAEAGVNHNGSLQRALTLIDVAAEAGADVVKFQTFRSEAVISNFASKADYQIKTTGNTESQLEMVKKLELDKAAHRALVLHCSKRSIRFMSTPFDLESVDFLANELDLKEIKIPSGEITNGPLLFKIARSGRDLILSTGMCTLGEIEMALGVLAFGYTEYETPPSIQAFERAYGSTAGQSALKDKVTLLHCTTEYPAPFSDINLRAMETLRHAFDLPVGYSDHTEGISVSIAAVALGAVVIEKHFTLDRTLPGPDHKASIEPDELKQMVQFIREVESSLGSFIKRPVASERGNRAMARKSLVAARDISKGESFTSDNLAIKRPGDGIAPMRYWDWLGKVANRDYRQDEKVQP